MSSNDGHATDNIKLTVPLGTELIKEMKSRSGNGFLTDEQCPLHPWIWWLQQAAGPLMGNVCYVSSMCSAVLNYCTIWILHTLTCNTHHVTLQMIDRMISESVCQIQTLFSISPMCRIKVSHALPFLQTWMPFTYDKGSLVAGLGAEKNHSSPQAVSG